MSATLQREKAKRKTKSKTRPKGSITARTTPLQRSRLFLLPAILVFTFTVLILGVIYAYCVASPHTMLTDSQLASPSDIEIDGSIFGRRAFVPNSKLDLGPVPTSISVKRNALPESGSGDLASITATIAGGVNSISQNSTHARQPSRADNKSSLSAALVFYTLTSPLFTILLISAELILIFSSNHTSNQTSIPSPIEEPRPRSRFSTSLTSRRAHFVLLILTLLNIASLTTTSSFWTYCELPPPSITTARMICPAEIRGHWMGGIHEVSIAKITIGWLVVIGLVCHAFFIYQNMRVERRRWAVGSGHGSAEEVDGTLKMEEGELESGHQGRWGRVRFH
jgi:hypothetical protein